MSGVEFNKHSQAGSEYRGYRIYVRRYDKYSSIEIAYNSSSSRKHIGRVPRETSDESGLAFARNKIDLLLNTDELWRYFTLGGLI